MSAALAPIMPPPSVRRIRGTGDPTTPRHGPLQAALSWSYYLLTPAEQALWRRCSVFTGSFDLDAAEFVCAGGGIAPGAVADLVDGLVAKSVLLRRPGGQLVRAAQRLIEDVSH